MTDTTTPPFRFTTPPFRFTGHATRQRVKEDLKYRSEKGGWKRGEPHWVIKLREHWTSIGRKLDAYDAYVLALEYVAGLRE